LVANLQIYGRRLYNKKNKGLNLLIKRLFKKDLVTTKTFVYLLPAFDEFYYQFQKKESLGGWLLLIHEIFQHKRL
jgi:hypothetical protein